MPVTLYVDTSRTFQQFIFLRAEPKMMFGSSHEQDVTKGGIPKWEVQVVATHEQFGRPENEIIKVSIISHRNPGDAIDSPQPVELVGLRVRMNPVERRVDKNGGERIVGGTITYQADEVRVIAHSD
ncbi:hypothetical protein ACIHFC_33105 [Streptomyces sp. NPDC052013]|uniref:hypothetical protein n=1 Tax=Streptomyces sp. NPDC052013 TaxID=3365679 RepID=UPI0037D335F7